MTGMNRKAMSVSPLLIPDMKASASTMRRIVRKSWVSCSETKFLMVSTSEVQRWMMSPVWFSAYQDRGRRRRCEKRSSRIRRTRVSAPFALKVPARKRKSAARRARTTTARAAAPMPEKTWRIPGMRARKAGRSAAFPITVSTA